MSLPLQSIFKHLVLPPSYKVKNKPQVSLKHNSKTSRLFLQSHPFPGWPSTHGKRRSFISYKGRRSCLSWSIPSPNIMRYSPFMICWSSIWRVCTARPGWSLAVRLIRWIERRPSTTAATSSSSRKMTRLVCSITALQNGQGDVINNQGQKTLKHQLSSYTACQCLHFL